ncbi:Thiol-disulfide isomerase or thioredoxin [bacterium A37T11]|nr:Thiol-disulfide isomerase or thioredoxin [bacterium A37T11]
MKTTIKVYILFAMLYAFVVQVSANTKFFADSLRPLKVGDVIPNIPLGNLNEQQKGQIHMDDYRGKLVILDFWNTACAACIKAIPEMQKLQREFGDQIKVLYVNMWESESQIRNRLLRAKNTKLLDIFETSSSLVAGGETFRALFPYVHVVPHHVWIGKQGQVIGTGAFENSNAQKIREYLDGRKIVFLNNANTAVRYDGIKPLAEISHAKFGNESLPRYIFTEYNNQYLATSGGEMVVGRVDSAANTVRDTYLNHDLLSLFKRAIPDSLLNPDIKVAFSPNRDNSKYWMDFVSLPKDTDTIKLSTRFYNPFLNTDYEIRNNRVCYEQHTPTNWTDAQRKEYMLINLNAFLEARMGLECGVEEKVIRVYKIIRTSATDKISARNPLDSDSREVKDTLVNGIPMKSYTNYGFSEKAMNVFTTSLSQSFQYFYKNSVPKMLIIDDTGFVNKVQQKYEAINTFRVDMIMPLPINIKTIEDLRSALKSYDLDVIESHAKIKFMSFYNR